MVGPTIMGLGPANPRPAHRWRLRPRQLQRLLIGGLLAVPPIALSLSSSTPAFADYGTTPALQLPFPTGTSFNISGFSYSNTPGCGGYSNDHQIADAYALDFGLPAGTEVDAAAYGTVALEVAAASSGGYGNVVVINHPGGLRTLYAHLQSWTVSLGATVYKGQQIAWSDSTGFSIGAHLHFAVRSGGTGLTDGTAHKPEPMSGYPWLAGVTSFGNYGCGVGNTTTTFTSYRPLQQVTVVGRPDSTGDLFVRSTDGSIYHAPLNNPGDPQFWETIYGTIKGSANTTWNSGTTQLDGFGVGLSDYPHHQAWVSSGWQGWSPPIQVIASGQAETEQVNVARRPNGSMDYFLRGADGQGYHVVTDANGNYLSWDGLGGALLGAPAGRWNAAGTRLDVYAIGQAHYVHHKTWVSGTGWSAWSDPITTAITSGTADAEQVSVVRRPDDTMDLLLRGPDQAGYHIPTDTSGTPVLVESIGGTIKGAPDGKWDPFEGQFQVFAIGINDYVHRDVWVSGLGWGGWQLASTGVVSA